MKQNTKPRKNNRQKYSKNNHVVKPNVIFGCRSGSNILKMSVQNESFPHKAGKQSSRCKANLK
ncbi:hypothetical protein CSQ88_02035 [Iodobacter sp. BJB302]|nr:hypothetical protein CSQ88_02035 [Iodobacter sp. BJB302]